MTETWCEDCDLVHSATRNLEPWKWRCLAAHIEPGFGFVSRNHSPDPPYEKCSRVNRDGACPFFEPARHLEKQELTSESV